MPDMTALAPFEADVDPRRVPLDVEIVVPVYNEAAQLEERFTALRTSSILASRSGRWSRSWTTPAPTIPAGGPSARRPARGRGGPAPRGRAAGYALRAAWSTSDAPVVAYMDVDLSTVLKALLPLVAPLVSGHSDVAIGTRLAAGRTSSEVRSGS